MKRSRSNKNKPQIAIKQLWLALIYGSPLLPKFNGDEVLDAWASSLKFVELMKMKS
ncbi:hypothetical protein RchiOBHm_Chr1g0350451 [Rosa chinensis]|uniref:Uncharacterized protein n=1 Tax=Rosa chinensis TaxID=74649 RepID=A0A2P6SG21_ROSCH|nr:hypothetical protein RchiOBHm_Chr1g0350451 [Rosa chinensis]